MYITYIYVTTSSTAQGGGGSFKNGKPIGEVSWCDAKMAERTHWWIERWLSVSPFLSLFLSFSLCLSFAIYLQSYLSSHLPIYLSIHVSIDRFVYSPIYSTVYLSVYPAILCWRCLLYCACHEKCICADPLQISHACHRFWKCYKTLTF